MHAKPALRPHLPTDDAEAPHLADLAPRGSDALMRDAQFRLKNSLDVPTLLAEVQSPGIPTEKLAILAMIAWKQHTDSATILTASIKSLRGRLASEEYRTLLAQMPGFAI